MPKPERAIRLPPGIHIEAVKRLREGWHPKRIVKPWEHIRIVTSAGREPEWAEGGIRMVAMCKDKGLWEFRQGSPGTLRPVFTAEEVDRLLRAFEASRPKKP